MVGAGIESEAEMVKAVGLAWYHESDYMPLRKLFEDGEKLHATYHEWLQAANLGFERLKKGGHIVEKVYITPDEFSAWCTAKGKRLNAESRIAFVNEAVAKKYIKSVVN
jgi:hypothetical protein